MSEAIDFHGLPAVRWRSRDGASAVATLQGAQLVSWIPAGGGEALYLSESNAFAVGRSLRGGIPVCFPQFADRGALPQHGFARNLPWRFMATHETDRGASATFMLASSPQTAAWPHPFRLELVATIAASALETALTVTNTGADAFRFTAALHTYLRIETAERASLEGLSGMRYVNRGSLDIEVEQRTAIPATDAIDRVYFATPPATTLRDGRRAVGIEQRGFTDTVVWNPGRGRAGTMIDMHPEGWRHMLCVEAAAIESPVTLLPGGEWTGSQRIVVCA